LIDPHRHRYIAHPKPEAGDLALVFKAEEIDDFWENSAGEVCSGGGGSGSIEPDVNVLSAR